MASADPFVATIGDAVAQGARLLREAGSPSARLDAELLAALVTGRERTWVLAHPEAALDGPSCLALATAMQRRATGEPIAYVRGFKEWHGLRLRTDRRALIPRPETELLADTAVEVIRRRLGERDRPVVVWDVGTGSGAIAVVIGLALRGEIASGELMLVASDVSGDALALASENVNDHGLSSAVRLVACDLLEGAGGGLPRPHVVVANLPYVATAAVASGVGSLAHEPRLALDGGTDGLDLVRRLLSGIAERAAPAGTVLLEVVASQADTVRALAPARARVDVLPDLAGIPRIVRINLPDQAG